MYKYLQGKKKKKYNSLNMITNVNSSLPEVYFLVIHDWLGTYGVLILVGISLLLLKKKNSNRKFKKIIAPRRSKLTVTCWTNLSSTPCPLEV